ncbi:MAG: DUF1499 domain-containing protein [Rhodobacteraceae bacterium]|nr:DUF1499 domain-containing protein [Paracoccaceae bacterium]
MRRRARVALVALALVLAGAAAWVRLAPSDPAHWHTDPVLGTEGPNSHVAQAFVALPPAAALAALDRIARATPRTQRLAGSPEEGRITYVTRSALWGFPDYTTVAALPEGAGTTLVLHARSRFGGHDWGVNAARVTDWLARLAAAGP